VEKKEELYIMNPKEKYEQLVKTMANILKANNFKKKGVSWNRTNGKLIQCVQIEK